MSPATKKKITPLPPETAKKALAMAAWLKEKKAEDIVVLDMSGVSPVAEVMVIATAQGARHAQALADWILEKLAETGLSYLGMEGYREGKWILVDCNDVLAHIFQEESRSFYNLDGLWSHCAALSPDASPSPLPTP